MPSPSLEEALAAIRAGEPFAAELAEAGAAIAFDPSQPYLCAAIHDGARFSADLEPYCLLSSEERRYEEDPHTGELIQALPNRIIGLDSRYEYDVNRAPEACVYDVAWGRKVWRDDFPEALRRRAVAKHAAFHRVVDAMVEALIAAHGACVIYDVHSYNGVRRGDERAPDFNLGTEQIDMRRHRRVCAHLLRMLGEIRIDGEPAQAALNNVFYGRGYLATRCRALSRKALCLPIEIKKFFCDEKSGAPYPQILADLKLDLTRAIAENAAYFMNSRDAETRVTPGQMLPSALDPNVIEIDRRLYAITRKLETLLYVNPINFDQEKTAFFARKGRYEPRFKYRKLEIDPFLFKESLFRLPIETIADATIQALFRRAVEGLSAEIDMLATIGGRQCLYNSLRYYGEPGPLDLDNARFLLHAPAIEAAEAEEERGEWLDDAAAARVIQAEVDSYRIDAPVQLSSRIVAGAMVDNSNYRVLVRKGLRQSRMAVDALKHHEVGVHLLTAAEARRQPLRLFRLGLPGSTETQEGLAVLAEHLSGNLSIDRLKTLGLRVVAVRCLIDDYSFSRTFDALVEQHGATPDKAFLVTTRVFRGGGFTKDYLYLRGLAQAYRRWREGGSDAAFWAPFLIGKSAFDDEASVQELLNREILKAPKALPKPFAAPAETNPILDYLLSALRSAPQEAGAERAATAGTRAAAQGPALAAQ